MTTVQLLEEIARLDPADAPAVMLALAARLAAVRAEPEPVPATNDTLLTIAEIAPRIGKSLGWCYHNWRKLPFAVRGIGAAPRFSKRGLESYIAKRQLTHKPA